jgi:SAM-dependent methyltransferase
MIKPVEILRQVIRRPNSIGYYLKRVREHVIGIDMIRPVPISALGIPTEFEPVEYSMSDLVGLVKIFSKYKISENDAVIDIGCGKGAVISVLSRFKFGRIDGIEYSKELFQIAQKNIASLKIQNAIIYNQNAADFSFYERYSYIYMYNPFGRSVIRCVIDKIERTLEVNNRDIYIVYGNPVYHDEIIKHGVFKNSGKYKSKMGYSIYTYANNISNKGAFLDLQVRNCK